MTMMLGPSKAVLAGTLEQDEAASEDGEAAPAPEAPAAAAPEPQLRGQADDAA